MPDSCNIRFACASVRSSFFTTVLLLYCMLVQMFDAKQPPHHDGHCSSFFTPNMERSQAAAFVPQPSLMWGAAASIAYHKSLGHVTIHDFCLKDLCESTHHPWFNPSEVWTARFPPWRWELRSIAICSLDVEETAHKPRDFLMIF